MMEVLTNLTVAIILQYISVSNHQYVHLHLHNAICQLYVSKARRKKTPTKPNQ